MRNETELYTRNKGLCDYCKKLDRKVAIYKLFSGMQIVLCRGCLLEGIRKMDTPAPRKKKLPDPYKSEVPENEAMASIQRGLADAKQGRTSKVEL